MLTGLVCFVRMKWVFLLAVAAASIGAAGQDAPMPAAGPKHSTAQAQTADPATAPAQQVPALPVSNYDKSIFQKPIPPDQLTFLKQFDGAPSGDLYKDKQFHKLLKGIVPDCMFHFGVDVPLGQAMDAVFNGSPAPVRVREGRYVLLSGVARTHHDAKGLLWFDLQGGIGLGGFFFRPGNGEPTPAVNIFSRQVKEDYLAHSQLPPGFAEDLIQWSTANRIPPVTARYFITGSNKKILLEHDEDYCLSWDGTRLPPESGCMQMGADAADLDLTEAYYVEATHHATNATAWMMNQDQVAFLQVRDNQCGVGPDPLGCRILMTRERVGVVIKRPPPAPSRPVRH